MFHMLITSFDNELILVANYLTGTTIKLPCFKILEKILTPIITFGLQMVLSVIIYWNLRL